MTRSRNGKAGSSTRSHPLMILMLPLAACTPELGDAGARSDEPTGAAIIELPAPAPAATEGLDGVLLARAFERAAELPQLHSLLVARHGELAREEYFRGPGRDGLTNIKSASKSVISALIGIAIDEGQLAGIDQPVAAFFPEYIREDADPRILDVDIEDLLSMRAGLEPTSFDNYGRWVSSENWVRYALQRPFAGEPGGRMLYSTGNTHVLSAILTRATDRSTLEYAREKLARPLGIELAAWTRGPQGVYFGGNEMQFRPRDLLLFGELYRNGGRHEGEQIVPEEWIRNSWVRRTSSRFNGHGYGLGWWMRRSNGHDVYFAWGYGGQYIFIVPDLELTVVTTSDALSRERGHNRSIHRIVDDFLVPAAERGATPVP